ncbi:MAG: YceI family protein [Cryomorphaceae bacterium]|nr:YceI family protein [Flavobacteriales bacterium]
MRYLILLTFFTFATGAFAQNLLVLPESEVTFSVSNLKVNTVRGSFSGLRGEGSFDPGRPEKSNFEVSVGASTVETGIGKRDRHLQEEEFFNSEAFPRIAVKSRDVTRSAVEGRYQFKGELTIKDISKPIECAFSLKNEGNLIVLEAGFTILRSDFNLGESYGSFVIGEEVDVQVKLICDVR